MKKPNATRFPAARIKKLIQADEDVGKVASATPVVVSKALELFLGNLVAECVKDATARGSNKITAYGLKRTITSTELFDFCSDIVANVPDPITEEDGGAGGAGGEPKKKRQRKKPTAPKMNDSDIEGENPPPKKRQATKAKVVKDEAEEDDGESDEPKASGSGNVGNVKDESDDYSDGGEE